MPALFASATGTVVVRDFVKGKNVTVKAGKKYVARKKKSKKQEVSVVYYAM